MSFTPVIDTAISLVFTFLILSLICSAIYEFIAERRNLRGKLLYKFLLNAFDDKSGLMPNFGHIILKHPLLLSFSLKYQRKLDKLSTANFVHVFCEVGQNFHSAYCKSTNQLADADDIVKSSPAALPPRTSDVFCSLFYEDDTSCRTLDYKPSPAVKQKIAEWYEELRAFVSFQYKRNSRLYLFYIGLLMAISLNIDTLHLIQRYWVDAELRSIVVSLAEKNLFLENNPKDGVNIIERMPASNFRNTLRFSQESLLAAQDKIEILSTVPIGWKSADWNYLRQSPSPAKTILFMFLGWVVTAMTLSFGAPFWYDVMRQLFQIKSLVTKSVKEQA